MIGSAHALIIAWLSVGAMLAAGSQWIARRHKEQWNPAIWQTTLLIALGPVYVAILVGYFMYCASRLDQE